MMKKILLLTSIVLSVINFAYSQGCNELFFSEYVEGYANNKALEIYNPTSSAINLSGYSIARFSNGSTVAAPETDVPSYIISLPDVMLEPYDVYVVVVDLTDLADWETQFDKPAWNGMNLLDTLFDAVTMEPIIDNNGNVVIGPQYSADGAAIFGTEYNERYDLQGKADVFLCPDYDTNRTMYFNGNDAMALLKGKELSSTGDNILDVIGVIGENPENTIMEDAWVSPEGYWLTKDRTLVRQPSETLGRFGINDVVFSQGGTFDGTGWDSWFKNTFCFLGQHVCDCDPNPPADGFAGDCGFNPNTVGTSDFNKIKFEMFPNPLTSNKLTIKGEASIQSIQVYNLTGQLVFNQKFDGNNQTVETNIPEAAKGFLIVKVRFENDAISVQKLVRS